MCYVKCQNILVNVLVHLLEHLSFWLRCPSFLLSKFASQLKLIQSVVRVGILGIWVTSSILRVLLSGFWVSGLQFPSPRDLFPGSWVSGSHFTESQFQGPVSQGPSSRSPGSHCPRFQGPRIPGLRSQGPRSRIPGPDFRLCPTNTPKRRTCWKNLFPLELLLFQKISGILSYFQNRNNWLVYNIALTKTFI